MSEVLVERRGRVAVVTLNRPESLNGFTTGLRNALKKELQAVAADDAVRAGVLTGAGRGFSAGADLKSEPMTSGTEVELVVYLREGHVPMERAHALDAIRRTQAWFDRHLRSVD